MKKMFLIKRIVFVVMAAFAMGSVGCASGLYHFDGEEYKYNYDSSPSKFGDFEYRVFDKKAHIWKYNGREKDVVIPSMIKSYPVVGIRDDAFQNKQLTSVVFPEGITEIGFSAFKGNQLTSVTFPKSIKRISGGAFKDNQLTSVTFPEGIKEIWGGAFEGNQLTSVTFPEGIKEIGVHYPSTEIGGAFESNQLTSVTFPEGIKEIGIRAFMGNQLTNVTFPKGIKKIDFGAFANNQLTSVVIPYSVGEVEGYAFNNNQLTSVTFLSETMKIGRYAFANNQLTSVTIPKNIRLDHRQGEHGIDKSYFNGVGIAIGAFENNKLTGITIPASVDIIGDGAFKDNPITQVTLESDRDITVGRNNFGTLRYVLAAYGNIPGGYTLQGDVWYLNGKSLGIAELNQTDGFHIREIDGVGLSKYTPFDWQGRMYRELSKEEKRRFDYSTSPRRYYIPAGQHTILVEYYKKSGYETTRSVGGVTFEHRYLFEGRSYLFTGEVQGNKILFRIVPQ